MVMPNTQNWEKCPQCNAVYIEFDNNTSECFCLECKHRWKMPLVYNQIKNAILRLSIKNPKSVCSKSKKPVQKESELLRQELRALIDRAMKRNPDIESQFIYEWIINEIFINHLEFFEGWMKKIGLGFK